VTIGTHLPPRRHGGFGGRGQISNFRMLRKGEQAGSSQLSLYSLRVLRVSVVIMHLLHLKMHHGGTEVLEGAIRAGVFRCRGKESKQVSFISLHATSVCTVSPGRTCPCCANGTPRRHGGLGGRGKSSNLRMLRKGEQAGSSQLAPYSLRVLRVSVVNMHLLHPMMHYGDTEVLEGEIRAGVFGCRGIEHPH
jgi:hypothetical protein